MKKIFVKGARTHNLKNIDVTIPRNELVVVTGVSGSGKSSLVFDTLYAEGHRRYVESLSAYARQFLARLPKPDVDYIQNISPAIAVEQRSFSGNPRSTVGSITEIYDYLRLLYARIGRTYSPITGEEVRCDTVSDVVDYILSAPVGTMVYLVTPFIVQPERTFEKELELTLQKGFSRLLIDNQIVEIEDVIGLPPRELQKSKIYLLLDRLIVPETIDDDLKHRLADSVQTAFNEGQETCVVIDNHRNQRTFSERFERDGIVFEQPTEALFNFNNSLGACSHCEGFGRIEGYDENLIIPNTHLSVSDGCVAPWHGEFKAYHSLFCRYGSLTGFPLETPYRLLSDEDKTTLWEGIHLYENLPDGMDTIGIYPFFKACETQTRKVNSRIVVSKFRGLAKCPVCKGTRLKPQASYIKVANRTISEMLSDSIVVLHHFFENLNLPEHDAKIASRILVEIKSRLAYLVEVGLGYLNLSRKANSLSGGESQRIRLATSLGSNLVGSLYILDEPSIGLHPRDGDNLIKVLERLRNIGNTVIVVEHDDAMMRRSNYLIDMGPFAGEKGGDIIFQGAFSDILAHPTSLTGQYLSSKRKISVPNTRRKPTDWVIIEGAAENNLKNIDVKFPLGVLCVVTGVSGSGKTTLVKQILYPALGRKLQYMDEKPGAHKALQGSWDKLKRVELVDQNSVGKNLRSNSVTYVGAFDPIRDLFAGLADAKTRNLRNTHFSYNVPGGRCEACEGEGEIIIQMQFLPDVRLTCEICKGKRYKDYVLEVKYKGIDISEVLNLTVQQALVFFEEAPRVVNRLKILDEVGLGYVRLGQSTSTLSGGELQRLKLAVFLSAKENEKNTTFFIFDEPTTGLHFHDIEKLMGIFQRLVNVGHTVLVIEHNLDVIKCADYIIDMGPEGGEGGGQLVFSGSPEEMTQNSSTYTAIFLKQKLLLEQQNS